MAEILIDDVLLREPNLSTPAKKPVGNVEIDENNSTVAAGGGCKAFISHFNSNSLSDNIGAIVGKAHIYNASTYTEPRTDRHGNYLHMLQHWTAGGDGAMFFENGFPTGDSGTLFISFLLETSSGAHYNPFFCESNEVTGLYPWGTSGLIAKIKGNSSTTYNYSTYSDLFAIGKMNHVAMTWDGGNFAIAHNGILVVESSITAGASTEGTGLWAFTTQASTAPKPAVDNTHLHSFGCLNERISAEMLVSLTADPYQILKPA